jgi:hypothetical protein
MSGDRQQVHPERVYIYWDFSNRLGGVGVHQGAVLVGDLGEFGDGLNSAHFVVGMHHGHEYRIWRDDPLQVSRIDKAMRINI